MSALRFKYDTPGFNSASLCTLLADPALKRLTLFATIRDGSKMQPNDGSDTNLPLVAALGEYAIPGFDRVLLVFDGLLMTAARKERYNETARVLDSAVLSNKAYFGVNSVPFTSSLAPGDAAILLSTVKSSPLEPTSRATFFRLLSNLSEAELLAL